jgi:hypothetical protein
VSVIEAIKLFDKADVPFEELVRNACAAGRSGAVEAMRKHPAAILMRRFREQVRASAVPPPVPCFGVCAIDVTSGR